MNLVFAFLPEIVLSTMIAILMIFSLFSKKDSLCIDYLSILSVVLALLAVIWQWHHYTSIESLFSEQYLIDGLSLFSKTVIFILMILALFCFPNYLREHQIALQDFYLLALFSVLGMSMLVSSANFISLYLSLELMSLPLYAMAAMKRSSRIGTEAALKYFSMGALSSGLLLFGISLLYGLTGQLSFSGLLSALNGVPTSMAVIAMIFTLSGLIFKLGAIPFHVWVPDVYQGAPLPVTLIIASAPKMTAIVVLIRVLAQSLSALNSEWQNILIVISVLSMALGNTLAIVQVDLKRMLAYSSIANMGYALLGLIAAPQTNNGFSSALFFVMSYGLMATGAFAFMTVVSRFGVELNALEDYRGLNYRNPWLAFVMLLIMFSMAGVPPTVGFFAKLGLLEALVKAHYVWLVVLALLFSIIGAYYYLRVVMLMYFTEPDKNKTKIEIPLFGHLALTFTGMSALWFGVFPSLLIEWSRSALY